MHLWPRAEHNCTKPQRNLLHKHSELSNIIIAAGTSAAVQVLLNFFRRYSEGRQPIHLVNAFEKTNGFW